jgi:membrane protease YdiL (CAAX protease family)
MVGGLILGWVYYRYGLVPAIVLHWLTNHLLLTYSIYSDMGSIITNDVLTSLTILVVANGVLSLLVYLRSIMADP